MGGRHVLGIRHSPLVTACLRPLPQDLLSMISTNLGDQPHDILRGAAEEVLACLKNDAMTDPERKRETEKLINSVTPEVRRTGVDGLGQRRRGAIRATSRRAPDDVRLGGLRVGVRGRAPPERVRQSGQIVAAHEGGEAG